MSVNTNELNKIPY